ncbi:MAG: hypothetical protein AAF216_05325 [Pseudomonadota bacterium]
MLKRLTVAIAAIFFAGSAQASPDLAQEWGYAASDLYVHTVHAIEGGDLPADFEDSLIRFAVNASRLGSWIEKSGGPADLGCIFRGMSEEAEIQLDAFTLDETRTPALRRLATLFYDAESVALAAVYAGARQDNPSMRRSATPISCVGSPNAALQYLTEQP